MSELSHLDEHGNAHMVDVGAKPVTERRAVAEGFIRLGLATRQAVFTGGLAKGDAVAVARIAAIQAAKRTSDLIPLCHPLPISAVEVEVEETETGARVAAMVSTASRTGVEMEALTAVALGLLALYDMVKGIDRAAEMGPVRLLEKSGGASGDWSR